VVTFLLGCLYLLNGLGLAWLFKSNFNLLGFLFNPKNKNGLVIFELPYIVLCFLAILEQSHWFLILLLILHLFNSGMLIFQPDHFYNSKNEMGDMDETFIINSMIGMLSVAGIFCIFISWL
jgi:hypothetical protein